MSRERRPLALLALFVVIAFVLDAIFFIGFFGSDDTSYSWAAHLLANGTQLDSTNIAHARLALNIPSAIVYWLCGGDIAWIAWFYVGYHLGLVIAAYAIGTMLHCQTTGLGAAALVATSPLLYVFAGAMLPDNATALWLAIVVILLELARRRALDPLRAATPRYFLAGLALGVAYSCKESALIMTIPAAACVIAATKGVRNWTWLRNGTAMAVGLAAFVVLEFFVLRITTGEWLLRINMMSDASDILLKKMDTEGHSPLDRFHFAATVRLKPFIPLTLWLLPIGSLLYIAWRRRTLLLSSFFWWPLAYLTVGSGSFTRYMPPSLQTRYYAIVVLPAAVMTAAVVVAGYRWLEKWRRRPQRLRPTYVAIALVVASTVVALSEAKTNLPIAGTVYSSARARALAIALERTHERYPHLPIVLSGNFERRMSPILFPRAPIHVFADTRISSADYPAPPFILLQASDRGEPMALAALDLYDTSDLDIETVDIIYAPRRRLDALSRAWGQIAGVGPARAPPLAKKSATIVSLVTLKKEAGHIRRIVGPMLPLKGDVRVSRDERGHLVRWSNEKSVSVQLFDARSYKRRPVFATAYLPDPRRQIELAIEARTEDGSSGELTVTVYGYTRAKALVAQNYARSRVGPTPVELRIVLDADVALERIKVRLTHKPANPKAGILRISHPRLLRARASRPNEIEPRPTTPPTPSPTTPPPPHTDEARP